MPCAVDYRYEDQKELQLVTRVACELVYAMRTGYQIERLSPETREWIRKHDQEDAWRKEAEEREAKMAAERQRVLDSLSPEHRRILGLG